MLPNFLARLLKSIKNTGNTRMFNILNKHLLSKGIKKEEIKIQKEQYFDKINSLIEKIDTKDSNCVIDFFEHNNSYKTAYENLKIIKEASELELGEYLDFCKITKLIINEKPLEEHLQLARDFKNYKLEEEEQGNFKQLLDLVKISLKDIAKILEVMIYTKNAGCPLPQKKIVKYYDSYRPASEDLELLKQAWIFSYERIKRKHDFDINIEDFIQAVKYKHDPRTFVSNFSRILDNEISIPFERYKNLDLDDQKISDLVSLLIKTKFANIFVDFDIVYNDLKLLDVWQVIRYLVRFIDTGFYNFDYMKLRNFYFFKGDLDKLHRAALYNRQKKIFEESDNFYETVVEITVVKNKNLNFDPLLFLISIELAEALQIEPPQKTDNLHKDIIQMVKNDYMAGYDVFVILNMISLIRKNDLNLEYSTAKLIEKSAGVEDEDNAAFFKNIVYKALQPVLFEGESFMVTTKDNIEIKASIMIETVMNLQNFFTGADEKVLLKRSSVILIDEIQRKYNHDEIIINIEKIANNVLVRLLQETRENSPKYITQKQMNKVSETSENGHENSINHKTETDENIAEENEMNFEQNRKEEKFINSSKYIPRKVLIPRIDYVKSTFKEYIKEKESFEFQRMEEEAKIEKIRAEIEIKKAWAKSGDLKYLILKDNEEDKKNEHR